MSTPVRILAFTMLLVVVFLTARAVGSVVGPVGDDPAPMTPSNGEGGHG